MAKSKKPLKSEMPVKDRTTFWSDLSYVPPEYKNEVWCAQVIYFAKKNARQFLDPVRANIYKKTGLLELNPTIYKQMFDPKTPGDEGGTAEYVSADWKAYPIFIHLFNNIKAEIQRTSKQIEANFVDKYSKTRKMRDSYKALYSRQVRRIINEVAPMMGFQPITESQDPYKWIKSFEKSANGEDPGNDLVSKFSELIKTKIESNEDLVMYNEMIYKGDYEQAMEKGIQHYMFNQNKWVDRWSDEFIEDIYYFNKAAGDWHTDKITGRPIIGKPPGATLWTSPYVNRDGDDLQYYYYEYLITFKDFVREIGFGLSEEKLKQVFEWNKNQGSRHNHNWIEEINRPNRTRDDAMIQIGRCSVLSQDCDTFFDAVVADKAIYEPYSTDWSKRTENEYTRAQMDNKNYNVWRTFYYIPPTTPEVGSNTNADFTWQANFIFDIKKDQDQFRTGEEGRYCKPPLVIYDNSRNASTADIVEAFMTKINFLWQTYQNCIINDVDATILSDELMGSMLAAVDEANTFDSGTPEEPTGANEIEAQRQQWKMIKQAGKGFAKMVDRQGNRIVDPTKLILVYKNGLYLKADQTMVKMLQLYEQLVIAIGNEPDANKPRVPVAGIEEAAKTSANAKWFMQQGYEIIVKQFAERFVRYILMAGQEVKKYGYSKRYDDFKDILGVTDGLLIEGMEDVPPEEVGLSINYVDPSAKKEFMMNLATQYVAQGKLDDDILYLIMSTDNWKEMWVMVRMGITKKKKEDAAKQQLLHEQDMELENARRQTALALNQGKVEGKNQNIRTQAQGKAMTDKLQNENKARTMARQKDQLLDNKLKQEDQKHHLQRQDETYKALAPAEP